MHQVREVREDKEHRADVKLKGSDACFDNTCELPHVCVAEEEVFKDGEEDWNQQGHENMSHAKFVNLILENVAGSRNLAAEEGQLALVFLQKAEWSRNTLITNVQH
jgi:hypothetical protein